MPTPWRERHRGRGRPPPAPGGRPPSARRPGAPWRASGSAPPWRRARTIPARGEPRRESHRAGEWWPRDPRGSAHARVVAATIASLARRACCRNVPRGPRLPGARRLDRIAPAAGRASTGDTAAKVHHHEEAPMNLLDPAELERLLPAETHSYASPIPTQSVSSDEFMPRPQTPTQKRLEARIKELGDELAGRQGMSRRRFFQTAAGMAAAFVAMNEVYGSLYDVSQAQERAQALSKQFVMDCHTHFLRDDTRIMTFVRQREAVGKAGWNPTLAGKPQTIEDLKFANYFKEVFLDSDTKVALISGAPSDIPQDWFLTNEMKV